MFYSEYLIHSFDEVFVVDKSVVLFVFSHQSSELGGVQLDCGHREKARKLVFGHSAFS